MNTVISEFDASDIPNYSVTQSIGLDNQLAPNSTLEKARAVLAQFDGSTNPLALPGKSVGLQVTLLGAAEVHSERLVRLTGIVNKLEQEVFSDAVWTSLTEYQKIELYKLAVAALRDSSPYVKEAINLTDWSKIQEFLSSMIASGKSIEVKDDSSVIEIGKQILKMLEKGQ